MAGKVLIGGCPPGYPNPLRSRGQGLLVPPANILLPIDKFSKVTQIAGMLVRITSKRQVTFPAAVLEVLGVGPGDRLEILSSPEGFLLRPRRVDHSRLAPLGGHLKQGAGTFNLHSFRNQTHDSSLRD